MRKFHGYCRKTCHRLLLRWGSYEMVDGRSLPSCNTECFREFALRIGENEPYAATYTVTATPEPGSALLLGGTILCFAAASSAFLKRRGQPRES